MLLKVYQALDEAAQYILAEKDFYQLIYKTDEIFIKKETKSTTILKQVLEIMKQIPRNIGLQT